MDWQAIEAGPTYGGPVFFVDQDTGDMTAAHWAVRYGVLFQRLGASIALSAAHWQPESKTLESSGEKGRAVADAPVTVAVCVLWLFIGAVADNALCGEGDARAQAYVATENGRKISQANARRDDSLLVSQIVETTVVEQKPILERGRARSDVLSGRLLLTEPLDALQGKAAQSAPARDRKQALENEQEWDRAEALARALSSSLQGELDAVRSAAEADKIKQKQLLDQERDRADALAHELSSLQAELDKARIVDVEAVQATEAEIKQKQALVQERDRADAVAHELDSLRAGIDAARIATPEVAHADVAKQEQAVKQERDRADALVRELTSVRADLDLARAATLETAQATQAAKIEQELAFRKERNKTETLARELAAARKEADARSALLAAAHAEVLQMTETNRAIAAEQKLALASEHDRTDALARELSTARSELEAGKRQIAALNALPPLPSRESAVGSSQERIAESSSSTIEANDPSPGQISGKAAASISQRSSVSELPRPEAPSAAPEASSHLVPRVPAAPERSAAT